LQVSTPANNLPLMAKKPSAPSDPSEDLRGLLARLGWSATRLACELEVSEDTVRRWLRGEHRPRGPARVLLRRLAEGSGAK
jgi:DNA-binding transcriptional regulator YiaG